MFEYKKYYLLQPSLWKLHKLLCNLVIFNNRSRQYDCLKGTDIIVKININFCLNNYINLFIIIYNIYNLSQIILI